MSRWNEYPKKFPSHSGNFLCTTMTNEKKEVQVLYFDIERKLWIDKTAQIILDTYEVYIEAEHDGKSCLEKLYNLPELYPNVIAWKNLSKSY